MYRSHEDWEGLENVANPTPSAHKLELCEHSGTHVDAINHMAKVHAGKSIDTMPLSMFYTEGICLDFRHKELRELIHSEEISEAIAKENLQI